MLPHGQEQLSAARADPERLQAMERPTTCLTHYSYSSEKGSDPHPARLQPVGCSGTGQASG